MTQAGLDGRRACASVCALLLPVCVCAMRCARLTPVNHVSKQMRCITWSLLLEVLGLDRLLWLGACEYTSGVTNCSGEDSN